MGFRDLPSRARDSIRAYTPLKGVKSMGLDALSPVRVHGDPPLNLDQLAKARRFFGHR